MATKTKATKESAPKAAKAIAPVPAPVKAITTKAKKAPATSLAAPPAATKNTTKPAAPAKEKVKATAPKPAAITVAPPAAEPAAKEESPVTPPSHATPLQDKKWLEIRTILEKLKEDTLREIRKSVKNGTEAVAAIEPGGDIYDQASSERDRELGLLLGDREREKIHSIDEALLRIDEGDYGICEECDEDIPLGRLKAMPFTRHCVKCKSDLEKLQAQTKRVEEERAYREIPMGAEEDET
jgi:DnaK suppressor protein